MYLYLLDIYLFIYYLNVINAIYKYVAKITTTPSTKLHTRSPVKNFIKNMRYFFRSCDSPKKMCDSACITHSPSNQKIGAALIIAVPADIEKVYLFKM